MNLWRRLVPEKPPLPVLPVTRDEAESIGRARLIAQGYEVREPVVVTQQEDDTWFMITRADTKCLNPFAVIDGHTGKSGVGGGGGTPSPASDTP